MGEACTFCGGLDLHMKGCPGLWHVDRAERRERIATAVFAAVLSRGPTNSFEALASESLAGADALIAAMDAKE